MTNYPFERKTKESRPVLALCYDFDKTLSPDDMQAQGFIQSVGYNVSEFWKESNRLAETNGMDQNLAYMLKMIETSRDKFPVTERVLREYGAQVRLFPGVESWFRRIRAYGEAHDVIIEHYIISSGLKEMIEGTVVADEFEKIYACSFCYDENGFAKWPAQIVNYTGKTQFLFRIEKGVLNINDPSVNEIFPPDQIRVPFRNIVYLGDSDTDVPCMKLVNSRGGHSIGVYNEETDDHTKVYKMMRENRIKYFAPADYSDGSRLDGLIKNIIEKTAAHEKLEDFYYRCSAETAKADADNNMETRKKFNLLIALENSTNFANTHSVIARLRKFPTWTPEELQYLFAVTVRNSQVFYTLNQPDIQEFYMDRLADDHGQSPHAEKIRLMMEQP